jgi:hypothetical protein
MRLITDHLQKLIIYEGLRAEHHARIRVVARHARLHVDHPHARAGGRTGPKQPGKSAALFNDSNRLSEGLAVRANPKEGAFTINVPANRFDESTFRSRAEFLAMLEKFGQLVPAVGQPETVLEDSRIQRAIKVGLEKVMYQKVQQGSAAELEVAKEGLELVRSLMDLGEIIEGE